MAPASQAISDAFGFKTRSNGSAGLVFAVYIGFCQFSFMFLTGSVTLLYGLESTTGTGKVGFGWGDMGAGWHYRQERFLSCSCLLLSTFSFQLTKREEKPSFSWDSRLEIVERRKNDASRVA